MLLEELIEGIVDVLGDIWFELFSPAGLIVSLILLLCGLEVVYYLGYGSWIG